MIIRSLPVATSPTSLFHKPQSNLHKITDRMIIFEKKVCPSLECRDPPPPTDIKCPLPNRVLVYKFIEWDNTLIGKTY